MRAPLPVLCLAFPLFAVACSDPPPTDTGRGSAKPTPQTLEHDFGIVPHGETRTHEFELDLAALGQPFVPLRVHIECSCGRADVRMRQPDGSERFVDGSGYARNLPRGDERAILHIELDTQKKEAVDLPLTQSRGYVLLQPLDDTTGMQRIRWPFLLRFGIDAPVRLHPYASLDFGRIAQSQLGQTVTTLRGDDAHATMTFGAVHSTNPDLEVSLEPSEGHLLLTGRCRPSTLGNHRALVTIETDLDGYTLHLDATWKVVPDLEATPIAKLSFRAPLDREQPADVEQRQFLLVTDHDTARSPEFVVRDIVDRHGKDARSHFSIRLQPMPGKPRQQRMFVRYLGGLDTAFRGRIVLGKRNAPEAILPIDLVVFPAKRP